ALEAEIGIDILLARGSLLEADALPGHIQLLREQHRQRGPDPLPHLRAVHDQQDLAVSAYPDPRVRLERSDGRFAGGAAAARQLDGEREASAYRAGAEEVPATECGHVVTSPAAR